MVIPETERQISILVVDDDKDVREFICYVLSMEGYSAIQANSGEQAWERFLQNQDDFDLVITDIVMPGLLGSDLASRILQVKPDLKFLFISGNAAPTTDGSVQMIEGINFLRKPFRMADVFKAIERLLA
jgi:two-component system cell cycle sensor histidine kinase/response regulator CckA